MSAAPRQWVVHAAWLLALCLLGGRAWKRFQPCGIEDRITGGNGRADAVAVIDPDVLDAQLRQQVASLRSSARHVCPE